MAAQREELSLDWAVAPTSREGSAPTSRDGSAAMSKESEGGRVERPVRGEREVERRKGVRGSESGRE